MSKVFQNLNTLKTKEKKPVLNLKKIEDSTKKLNTFSQKEMFGVEEKKKTKIKKVYNLRSKKK